MNFIAGDVVPRGAVLARASMGGKPKCRSASLDARIAGIATRRAELQARIATNYRVWTSMGQR